MIPAAARQAEHEEWPEPGRVPVATYRLQLGPRLTFDDVAALLDYLRALGISDCYTSPFFETSTTRSHGYDVSDHNRFRAELGGAEAFGRLARALRQRDMGLLVDLVPNHMGIAENRNEWWLDLLENGPSSRYAPFFDVDWTPVKRELAHKVLLPILGDQYGVVLDSGRLQLELEEGVFWVRHDATRLPVAPRSYGRILGHRIERLQATLGAEHPALLELKSIITWFVTIPEKTETDPERLATRDSQKGTGRRRLVGLLKESSDVRVFVEDNVRLLNGVPGEPRSFDALHELLDDQAYRVAFWRVAGEEINYRRFFDINELAAIRMEQPEVFAETHRLVFRLVGDGIVTGLRIDHPDGLYAPAAYFRRLQRGCVMALARRRSGIPVETDDAVPTATGVPGPPPFYIVAEKILAAGERLPEAWPVAGTTGYDFLNMLNGIFVDRTQARALEDVYARLARGRPTFAQIVYEGKRLIMETSMASELLMLAHRLNVISEKHRSSRDFTLGSLRRAIREIIACFPVYRTYVTETGTAARQRDLESIDRAVSAAKTRPSGVDASVYDWIQGLLSLRFPPWPDDADRREATDWVLRFQQMTGPVTAKGYEDTALYRYHRLLSLNEVGGDPGRFGTSLAEFHAAMVDRQRDHPHGLSATSTHDTKRSEDVRARINVLSEIPLEWRARVARWQRLNRRHRSAVDGRAVPSPEEEYFVYQTLIGAWPIGLERLQAYLLKAAREAKAATSWLDANPRYEEAMARFAERLLDPRRSGEFLADFTAFQARVAFFGALNSLAQTLVKIAAPGVPDFYQGTELWDLSLVDPDNRRPVDWALRRRLLDAMVAEAVAAPDRAAFARALLDRGDEGRVKLFVIHHALAFRRAHAPLFRTGDYRPVEADGPLGEHVAAFARVGADEAVVSAVPRLLARRGVLAPPLGAYWDEATHLRLDDGVGTAFVNVMTGERVRTETSPGGRTVRLRQVFANFPVALLARAA